MIKLKNAAALIIAAGMTILPAYSLTQACRIENTIVSPAPPAAEEIPEDGENGAFNPSEGDVPSEDTSEGAAPPSSEDFPAPPVSDEEEKPEAEQNEQLYILCEGSGVNLRSGAGSGYSVVATAAQGTSYAVADKTGGWYCVYYRGKKVYLSALYAKEFTLKKSDAAAVEAVLEEGYKLIGTPYVFGAVRLHDGNGNLLRGFTKNAFDCSSLTQYTFYTGAHVLLGTTTRIQVREGKYVKKSDLRRGDCIYFTNASRYYNTGIERIGHVAIYLGEGYILHTSSDYARIEKLTAAREKYYIEARRFV